MRIIELTTDMDMEITQPTRNKNEELFTAPESLDFIDREPIGIRIVKIKFDGCEYTHTSPLEDNPVDLLGCIEAVSDKGEAVLLKLPSLLLGKESAVVKFSRRSYVKVLKAPDPWEGSGESDSDRESLVGHVGIVVDHDDIIANTKAYSRMYYLVRFPSHLIEHKTCQRWIEEDKLQGVALPPKHPISFTLLES